MKAAYYEGNRTFRIGDAPLDAPGPGELRLDVAYVGICGTDVHIYHGAMDHRVARPQIIGHEMSGRVAEVGAGVTGYTVGDPVVVRPLDSREETPADRGHSHICRGLRFLGIDTPGAFQNSWTVPAFAVHKAPADIDLRLAALAEPLAVACHDVKLSALRSGELAVVIGGGPIGLLVALVAQQAGARVVVAEVNTGRLELARELGIEAFHPGEVDLPAWCREQSGGAGADVVFEVSGAPTAVESMTDLLAIRGRIVVVAIHPQLTLVNLQQFFWKELSLCGARVYEPDDYERALALVAEGKLPLDRLITRVEPLARLPEAFAALEQGSDDVKVLIDCRRSCTDV